MELSHLCSERPAGVRCKNQFSPVGPCAGVQIAAGKKQFEVMDGVGDTFQVEWESMPGAEGCPLAPGSVAHELVARCHPNGDLFPDNAVENEFSKKEVSKMGGTVSHQFVDSRK
eukprot:3048069-Ditylum_brightwellii.AAC.1